MATNRRPSAGRAAYAVWAAIGVAVLAIVVVVLSFAALTQHRSTAGAGSTPGASMPPADVTRVPAEPQPSVPAPALEPVAVPNRVIAAIDADSVVRAVSTTCPAPSTIEVTDDAGATWESFDAAGIATVQRITAGSNAFVALIGLGVEDCTPAYERSFTGGVAWEAAPGELTASWFVDPSDRAGLHAPTGDRSAPCGAIVQVAVVDEASAAVLCADSSIHLTVDGGAAWLPAVSVPGASAIGAGGSGFQIAVVNQNACVGAQLVALALAESGPTLGAAGACLEAVVGAGDAAVAVSENTAWLWVGDEFARTEDGGGTWS